jgi:uncharacterized protein (DUF302 family)
MSITTPYTFGTRLPVPIDDARQRVEAALKVEGFGILTEIDVAETLKRKLDLDRPPYLILGACNPSLAHRALEADASIGALLPCNVVLRADGDATIVEIMDPRAAMQLAESPAVGVVAGEARERLQRVIAAIED